MMPDDTKRLLTAVFANRPDEVKKIINQGNFNKRIFTDVLLSIDEEDEELPPIPLYYISLCNKIYLEGDWTPGYKKTIERNLEGCHLLIEFWRKNGFNVDKKIEFPLFRELCAHFTTDWTMEDLLEGDLETLKSMGYDDNEVRLCYAILTYDKKTIWELLEKKVDLTVWISGEVPPNKGNDIDCFSGYSTLIDSLNDPQICYDMLEYYRDIDIKDMPDPNWVMLRSLFGGAAYQEILNKIYEEGINLNA